MRLYPERNVLAVDGVEVRLPRSDILVLEVLSSSPRRVWTQAELAGACYLSQPAVSASLGRIRDALGKSRISIRRKTGVWLVEPLAIWIAGEPGHADIRSTPVLRAA